MLESFHMAAELDDKFVKINQRCRRFRCWPWEWAPRPRKICCCVPLPLSVHLLYWSPEKSWPTWGGGFSSFEGWMAPCKVLPAECPPIITHSLSRSMANLLNDLGEDKRRLIDTTYLTDDLHVTMCPCCWMTQKFASVARKTSCHSCWLYVAVARHCVDVVAMQEQRVSSVTRYQTEEKITALSPPVVWVLFYFAESHVIGIKHKHWQTAECWSINNSCKRNG